MKRKIMLFFFVGWTIGALAVTPSFAYLDAGTGSMILQLILGGFTGLAVLIKLYWGNLKKLFTEKKNDNAE